MVYRPEELELALQCTKLSQNERDSVQARLNHGNLENAAIALNKKPGTVGNQVASALKKAAREGLAPNHFSSGVAPGYQMGKVTVQRNAEGDVVQTWERQHPDLDPEVIKAAIEAMCEDVERIEPTPAPFVDERDIIPWINIGDAHIGMLAHAAETGQNFDLKIGEQELCLAIEMLIASAPNAERCVINDLGDFTHYENFAGKTEASGHDLDYDTRFPRMIRVYSRIMKHVIEATRSKFKYVDVIINQGNHSRTNDIWMAELLRSLYADEPRVNILNNENIFITYRMGNTLVMTHHSDKCKPAKLADVLATDYAKDWGECEFRYIDIGHIHHNMVLKEHPGVSVESFNILAAKDKYAHEGGWRSRQSITMVLRSRTYGEVGRIKMPVEKVWDRIKETTGVDPTPKREVYSV